jgi:DNA repair protein radc
MNKYLQLSIEDTPQYKAANKGITTLTNVELLSMIINRGAGTKDSINQARQLLNMCDNNLAQLSKLNTYDMQVVEGIGDCKALAILAAIELGKRRAIEKVDRAKINSADAIYNYMHPIMQDLQHEEAWVLLLNQNFSLLKAVRLSQGGLSETAVDVRMALKEAIMNNATVIALTHNHPSGNTLPSRPDDTLTTTFRRACDAMRIYLLDHVIITDGAFYSYRESGKL